MKADKKSQYYTLETSLGAICSLVKASVRKTPFYPGCLMTTPNISDQVPHPPPLQVISDHPGLPSVRILLGNFS
jgi:hypothetical protein